ncbi:hypothetical protein IIA79_04385 [bacterium]|nr:hypothetical protein [bacterium]
MDNSITVAGAGSWGTTLAWMLAQNGREVCLLCRQQSVAGSINKDRRNPLYFPEVELPSAVQATTSITKALEGNPTVYLAVPARYLRDFVQPHLDSWQAWSRRGGVLCNRTKGVLLEPTERVGGWLEQALPGLKLVHLSGPNLAAEIMAGHAAAAVVAGPKEAAGLVRQQLMCDTYRVYTGDDPVGVEVAGFFKNIIAIAAGAASGNISPPKTINIIEFIVDLPVPAGWRRVRLAVQTGSYPPSAPTSHLRGLGADAAELGHVSEALGAENQAGGAFGPHGERDGDILLDLVHIERERDVPARQLADVGDGELEGLAPLQVEGFTNGDGVLG